MSSEQRQKLLATIENGVGWMQFLLLGAVLGLAVSTLAQTSAVVKNGVVHYSDPVVVGEPTPSEMLHEDKILIQSLQKQLDELKENIDGIHEEHGHLEHRLTVLETISERNNTLLLSVAGGVILTLIQGFLRWFKPKESQRRGS